MTRNRDQYPNLREDLGEDPARWLDHRLVEYGADYTDHTLSRMVRDRIHGIDRIAVVNAWIAVERNLDRGPRRPIIQLLEKRLVYLEEHGERPSDLRTEWPHELPDRYRPFGREVPPKEAYVIKRDGERVPYSQRPTTASVGRSSSTSQKVATDGGDER